MVKHRADRRLLSLKGETFLDERVTLHCGDCLEILKSHPDNSVDSIVTDPPYALVSIVKRFGGKNAAACIIPKGGTGAYARASRGFMGKQWDTGDTAFAVEFWQECIRILKPGGHVIAFGGTRTYHRLACAIEDSGFEIRDQIGWCFGSGFPKSHDVSKGIDRAAGAVRPIVSEGSAVKRMIPGADQNKDGWIKDNGREYIPTITAPASVESADWAGWGTALKPAWEPICLARKPLSEKTVAANVLCWGVGALNIDGCRVGTTREVPASHSKTASLVGATGISGKRLEAELDPNIGRWPANIIHDGSEEVIAAFPDSNNSGSEPALRAANSSEFFFRGSGNSGMREFGDSGSAARFFYSAKADSDDRLGSSHPTVKPLDLMQWLVRLVTPKGGLVLDPFAGTGTTAEACFREGMRCVLVEREIEYQADIRRRMALAMAGPDERARESIKAKTKDKPADHGPLFGGDLI